MTKRPLTIILALLSLGVVAGIAIAMAFSVDTTPPPAFISNISGRSDDGGDRVKGNCDEAEHRSDPECAGPQESEDDVDPTPTATEREGGDISSPCDKAEHANDPRCTEEESSGDNSGPGGGDDDDRSGDDHSGRGGGSDDD